MNNTENNVPISGSATQTEADTILIQRVTWLGFFMNLLLAGLKFLAGVFGNSQVLIADAVHSTSDLVTDAAVLIGSRYWGQPADDEHPYGHANIETLVTLIIGAALVLVGIKLVTNAVLTLHQLIFHQTESIAIPNGYALVAAMMSIVIKEWLFRVTASTGRKTHSTATVANAWHHRSDALSSIPAALAVGAVLILGNRYAFLDPIGTIVVGLMIFYTAILIIRPTFRDLLDVSGGRHLTDMINNLVVSTQGVQGVHKIRTRPLGASLYSVDLHIQVNPEMNVRQTHTLSHVIQDELCKNLPQIVEATIHVEPGNVESEKT